MRRQRKAKILATLGPASSTREQISALFNAGADVFRLNFSLQLGTLIGGAVITEYVFALPGVGRLVVDAVFARDYPLVQGVVLLIAVGYISGAVEFDDRPGPVRDALASMVLAWHAALERAIRIAVEEGHLKRDTDPMQMLFEIHGLILALHHDARFLRVPGAMDRVQRAFEHVLAHYVTASKPR